MEFKCKYGDLILWKQILKQVNNKSLSHIIFITSENKEDWWKIEQGKTLEPRPELTKEILDAGASMFHMYKPEQFLKYALEYLDIEIQEESIQQVEEVSAVKNPSKMLQAVKLSSDNISNISSIMARGFDSIKFGELMSKTSDKIRKSMEPIASTQGLEEVSAVKNSSEMLQAMTLASDNISNMSSIMAREFDPVKFGELMSKTSDKIRKNMEPIASINLASINLASLNRLDLEQLIANMKLKNVNLNTEQIQKLLQSQNFSQQNDKNPEEKNETLEEDS